jgi:hypothetical protein
MNGPEQYFLAGVMSVRHERYRHPGLNGFVLPADMPCYPPGAITEKESYRYRQAEACYQQQRSLPGTGHDITIERQSPLTFVDCRPLPSGMPLMLTFCGLSHAFH